MAELTALVGGVPHEWFIGVTLVLIALVVVWLGWDGWKQTRRVSALEDEVRKLWARQDRLQDKLDGKKTGWGDSLDLTKFNWEKPPPF